MTVTADSFLGAFPEFFGDPAANRIEFWLPIAQALVDPDKWGDLSDQAVSLALAHFCALGGAGSTPAGVGVLTSKSAGGMSASYDVSAVADPNAGHWNQTSYGVRFRSLQQMFGAGPLQVGTAAWPPGVVMI